LTAQHRNLAAEHQNLHVLGPLAAHALDISCRTWRNITYPNDRIMTVSIVVKPQYGSDKVARQQA